VAITLQSVTVGTFLGLLVGILTALKRGSWIDHLSMVIVVFFNAIPTFWLGLILILVFAVGLRMLPVQGTGTWQHFILPVMTLAVGQSALIARLTRSSLLEVLNSDFIRTARAKVWRSAKCLVHAMKIR
jgi:glutathione transport system permease protein